MVLKPGSKSKPNLAKPSQAGGNQAKGDPRKVLGFPWISFAVLGLSKGFDLRGKQEEAAAI
jgi:hypothetical protein